MSLLTQANRASAKPAPAGRALWRSGHRPFFLLVGLWGALAVPLWVLGLRGIVPVDAAWHGHEMVFGFATAAVAGFLQAAVPKWTGSAMFSGAPVMALVALWCLGRVGAALAPEWPLDLPFLLVLAGLMTRRVVRARNWRNLVVAVVLIALAVADVMHHAGYASLALRLGLGLVLTLITLIAGRIVPGFTRNALKRAGLPAPIVTPVWADRAAVPAVAVAVIVGLLAPATLATAAVSIAAAAILAIRSARWGGWQARRWPIVWVLHVAWWFLPLGFVLTALSALWPTLIAPTAALHAFAAGTVGGMILAVTSRATLGHAGLPLHAATPMVIAYGALFSAAVLRIGAGIVPSAAMTLHIAAASLWCAAWLLFLWVNAPLLLRPRVDGVAG